MAVSLTESITIMAAKKFKTQTFRLEEHVLKRLRELSEAENRSMNNALEQLLIELDPYLKKRTEEVKERSKKLPLGFPIAA